MHRSVSLIVFSIFILVVLGLVTSSVHAAPHYKRAQLSTDGKAASQLLHKKRSVDKLEHALDLGVTGVITGVEATLKGIQHPKTPGTKEDTIRSSTEAGENVGGAIGTALRGGVL